MNASNRLSAVFAVRVNGRDVAVHHSRELDWERCGVVSTLTHQVHYALDSAQGELDVEVDVPFA